MQVCITAFVYVCMHVFVYACVYSLNICLCVLLLAYGCSIVCMCLYGLYVYVSSYASMHICRGVCL